MDLRVQTLDLLSAGCDRAIRSGALEDSALVARKLASNRRVLCAAPDYLRRHGAPQTPEDLARHECILLSGSQGRRDTWRLRDRQGRRSEEHTSELQSLMRHSYAVFC